MHEFYKNSSSNEREFKSDSKIIFSLTVGHTDQY